MFIICGGVKCILVCASEGYVGCSKKDGAGWLDSLMGLLTRLSVARGLVFVLVGFLNGYLAKTEELFNIID